MVTHETMRALCASRPWLTRPVKLPHNIPGMLGAAEEQLFYFLTKEGFTGRGTIVDAGSYVGRSAYAFAQGLRANPRHVGGRDRIHCFDLFLATDQYMVDFAAKHGLGVLAIGQSMLPLFERHVAPVRHLLEVHAGDFMNVAWQRQPIEILMVDIAKSVDLGKRVVEMLFPDLVPGVSVVVQQDYHHPGLPHIHVVMEYLADHFELAVPRADYSALFLFTKVIPTAKLARVAAHDFTPAEQLELMDRAIRRLAPDDRHHVELVRIVLRLVLCHDPFEVERDLEAHVQRAAADGLWEANVEYTRDYLYDRKVELLEQRRDYTRMLEIADREIVRGPLRDKALRTRSTALDHLGPPAVAELSLRAAIEVAPTRGGARLEHARFLLDQDRIADAESALVDALIGREHDGACPLDFTALLGSVWLRQNDPHRTTAAMAKLREALPAEPEIHVLDARVLLYQGDRARAVAALRRARESGLSADRCAELLAELPIAAAAWAGGG